MKMTLEEVTLRARALLGDGKWTHNFYNHEEMIEAVVRVMMLEIPSEKRESLFKCGTCGRITKNPSKNTRYVNHNRCEDFCCEGPVVEISTADVA